MGSFNILVAEVTCPDCGKKHDARIQFKFGNTWQLQYKVGDTITWGGNDLGSPDLKKVKLYGMIESTVCPFCGKDHIPENYDIFVSHNVITGFLPIENIDEYLDGNREYIPLE